MARRKEIPNIQKRTSCVWEKVNRNMVKNNWMDIYDAYAYQGNGNEKEIVNLKRDNMPEKLFRYRSLDHKNYVLEELKENYVYLSSATGFNDPFESIGILSRGEINTYLDGIEDKANLSLLKNIKEEYVLMKDMVSDFGTECMKELQDECNHQLKIIDDKTMQFTESIVSIIGKYIDKTFRMVCFTTSNKNLPMWAHYAKNHEGVCIEYDYKNRDSMAENLNFFPIRYTKSMKNITKIISLNPKALLKVVLYILSRKQEEWSYENEWRYSVGNPLRHYSNESHEFVIKAVYLGLNFNDSEMLNSILKYSKKSEFQVYQMKKTNQGLKPEEIEQCNFEENSVVQ